MSVRDSLALDRPYQYGWEDDVEYDVVLEPGIDEDRVRLISEIKDEPDWMLKLRLRGLKAFERKPNPTWLSFDLDAIDFDRISFYMQPRGTADRNEAWENLPPEMYETMDKLQLTEQTAVLAGQVAQYDSATVFHRLQEDLARQGVVFVSFDEAVTEYEDIFRPWIGRVIPPADNKYAALNYAAFSGGSAIYVPPGVKVTEPLSNYFRINSAGMFQGERTLIVVDRDAEVTYYEGCSSAGQNLKEKRDRPPPLHSAVVELVALDGATINYITIQEWAADVWNLVTKRGACFGEASRINWVNFESGSGHTAKYPGTVCLGAGSSTSIDAVTIAGPGQTQDSGAKIVLAAPHTSGTVNAKGISFGGGRGIYRGLLEARQRAVGAKLASSCDALLLDDVSESTTHPYIDIRNDTVHLAHEATTSKIGVDQMFYLMSRGLSEREAQAMIVSGFVAATAEKLPAAYYAEVQRMIALQFGDEAIG
ncbi:MAG: Fe-S cluster assembly protein SufB [Acidimicrobiia bacterium]|nr:Fe-S cluster assembly protein SufB [Acidimicrobiia bacterium]